MDNKQSINYVVAFPKNKLKWVYYLNGNLGNKYFLKTDDFKRFLDTLTKSGVSQKITECMQEFQPFLIDVLNCTLREINIDLVKSNEIYKQVYWKKEASPKNVLKNIKQQEAQKLQSSYDIGFVNQNEEMIKKYL